MKLSSFVYFFRMLRVLPHRTRLYSKRSFRNLKQQKNKTKEQKNKRTKEQKVKRAKKSAKKPKYIRCK